MEICWRIKESSANTYAKLLPSLSQYSNCCCFAYVFPFYICIWQFWHLKPAQVEMNNLPSHSLCYFFSEGSILNIKSLASIHSEVVISFECYQYDLYVGFKSPPNYSTSVRFFILRGGKKSIFLITSNCKTGLKMPLISFLHSCTYSPGYFYWYMIRIQSRIYNDWNDFFN